MGTRTTSDDATSPSIVVVIRISVDHPVTEANGVGESALPSGFTDRDVRPTAHLAEVELTDEPAAVTRTRRTRSRHRLSTSRSVTRGCMLTVVAAVAVVGIAARISQPSANLTAALAVEDHVDGRSGPGAVTTAPTSRCRWVRFDLAESGVPGAGTGAVHRHARSHAIVAAPGPHTQTLYYRDCPGTRRAYRWRASTG